MMRSTLPLFVILAVACGEATPNANAPDPGGASKGVLSPTSEACLENGFMAGSTCFQAQAAACKEAGCDVDACSVQSGRPKKVSCKK